MFLLYMKELTELRLSIVSKYSLQQTFFSKPHSGLTVHQSVAKKLSPKKRGDFMHILSGHSVSDF